MRRVWVLAFLLCMSVLAARWPAAENTGVPAADKAFQGGSSTAFQEKPALPSAVPELQMEAPKFPFEEIQAEFLPVPSQPGEAYDIGDSPEYWRFSIEPAAIMDEARYGKKAWLESARAAVTNSLLYDSVCADNDWFNVMEMPLNRWFPDYGEYYGETGTLRPKLVEAIIRDFDGDGKEESVLAFRMPAAGYLNLSVDCIVFVNAAGKASLVAQADHARLSSVVYGTHMTLFAVRGGSGPIITNSYQEYRVRDGGVSCVLNQFWDGMCVEDMFRIFTVAQCPYGWLVFWDPNREEYVQAAAEPVDGAVISDLYGSGMEQPFEPAFLEEKWTLTGGVYYTLWNHGRPVGYTYGNGKFSEDMAMGTNAFNPPIDPIPVASGVDIAEAMEQAYPQRISSALYITLADKSAVALRFTGSDSYFSGQGTGRYDAVEVIDGGRVTQTLQINPIPAVYGEGKDDPFDSTFFHMEDVNFDGSQDLWFYQGNGNRSAFYSCYLWNPKSRLYEAYEPFRLLSNVTVDAAQKRVESSESWAFGTRKAVYRWEDGDLVFDRSQAENHQYPVKSVISMAEKDGEIIREIRYIYDGAGAADFQERPALPLELPAFSNPEREGLLRLLKYAPGRNGWMTGPTRTEELLPQLLDLVYTHNHEFLEKGGGIESDELKRLRESRKNIAPVYKVYTGRYARYSDMELAGKYLFGEAFRLERDAVGEPAFYEEKAGLDEAAAGGETRYFPLSVIERPDETEITFIELLVAGGWIINNDWISGNNSQMPQMVAGYVGGDGGYYLYDDGDRAQFPCYTAVFRKAEDGHDYIADCRKAERLPAAE